MHCLSTIDGASPCAVKRATLRQLAMKRDTTVNIRLTSAEKDELQRRADAAKRTLSDYIRLVLQAHLEDADTDKAERRKR
jgi:uncharacterized protein (DUF1778 family)